MKDKELVSEKKVEESFSLKQIIDKQRLELDKLKKKQEVTQDQLTIKEGEIRQIQEDFNVYKKKNKVQGD